MSYEDYVIYYYSGSAPPFITLTLLQSRMLRGITRVTLRRGIHTTGPGNSAAGLSRHRVAMAVGASVIAASYLGWRINLDSRTIALDSNSARMLGFFLFPHILL